MACFDGVACDVSQRDEQCPFNEETADDCHEKCWLAEDFDVWVRRGGFVGWRDVGFNEEDGDDA